MRSTRLVGSSVFIASVLVCLGLPAQATDMYKWTDADGNVHYTQSPPPGDREAEKMAPPPDVDVDRAQRELEQAQKKIEAIEEERQQAEKEQREEQERAALYRKNCDIARERLSRLENTGLVRAVDEDGNMTRIGPEEKQARIEAVNKDVEKYCNGQPG